MAQLYEDAEAPDGVELYDFEDFNTHRNLIFKDAREALLKQFPKVHNGVRMELADVDYVDPEEYTIAEQKEALHKDKYLTRRLRGKIRLVDEKTGEPLDEKEMTLMRVPYLTERGTFIREGNEWGTVAQQRLLPGAYSRYQNNGDLETQFNVRPGTGNAFRVNFNPESSQYKFNIAGSDLHLYSLMHDLGVPDDTLREKWGDDVFDRNSSRYDVRVLEKAYTKIVPEWDRKKNPGRSREEKAELIRNALNRSQVASNVVKKTLPNLFDRTKSAAWREEGEIMQKCASMSRSDLAEIATYINTASGYNIDTNEGKEPLKQAILTAIRTGSRRGDGQEPFNEDPAVRAVKMFKAEKFYQHVKAKIEKLHKS